MMKLISVNIGQEGIVQRKDHTEKSGIFKTPTDKAVEIGKLGLAGDVIISEKHHGGPDQAVYIYGEADYDWWRNELNRELAPGIFGENLTISALESATFSIGDILHIGEISLQVTAPRIACKTFAARMEDPQFVKKFRAAERPGLYCRVLKEGTVQVGDSVQVDKYEEETVTLLDAYRDFYEPDLKEDSIHRFLDAPIAIRMREDKEVQLKKLLKDSQISLKEVTKDNYRKVLSLKVDESQNRFVAPNVYSVAQAYFHHDEAWFRAIYAGETPVGFLMLSDNPDKAEYFLWRLMVDQKYQKMGFGRKAMELLYGHVKTRPNATALLTSCVPGEDSPCAFYKSLGFEPTGEIDDGEIVMRRVL